MAARSNKIFSEILCKQYKSSSKRFLPITRTLRRDSRYATQSLKKIVPNIRLNKDLFSTDSNLLQSAILPAISKNSNCLDSHGMKIPLKPLKAASVFPKSKNFLSAIKFNILRQYSSFNTTQVRYFANPNKRWGNQADGEVCEPKRECYRPCPKWQLGNCPPVGNNLDCQRPYIDPCCKKRLAPYPSYSESCAERLDDDPSECMQCPWSRCGGSEGLKYPKRRYHTGTLAATRRFKINTLPLLKITETEMPIICDAKKPPCKRPPGKCDKVQPVEKCPEPKKAPCPSWEEKCKKDYTKITQPLNWSVAYRMWADKNDVAPAAALDMELSKRGDDDCGGDPCKQDMITPDNSCCLKLPFDQREMDYEYKRQKKCHMPNPRRKKHKGPHGSHEKKADGYSALFNIFYDCQHKKKQCPGCVRRKCPDRDLIIDRRYKPMDGCQKDEYLKKMKNRKDKVRTVIRDLPNHDGLETPHEDL